MSDTTLIILPALQYTYKKEASGTDIERTTKYKYHPYLGIPIYIRVDTVISGGPASYKETIYDYDSDDNDTPNESLDEYHPDWHDPAGSGNDILDERHLSRKLCLFC